MVDAWTNFASNGTPGLSWTPLKVNSENEFLNISGTEPFMTTSQELQTRMDLFDTQYFRPLPTYLNTYLLSYSSLDSQYICIL